MTGKTGGYLNVEGEPCRPAELVTALISILWLIVTAVSGCSTPPVSTSATIHEVRIKEDVTPRLLNVQRGDEIRWYNLLPGPVQVGILDNTWQDKVTCQKGFQWFGQMNDLVTIAPQDYVSLCFSKSGTVRYNVWLDPKNLTGSMTPTSTIHID
jgi:hypothetical protein